MRMSKQMISSCRRYLKSGKDFHDIRFKNFYDVFDKESDFYGKMAKISEKPYIRNNDTRKTEKLLQHDISGFEEMYHNVFGDGATWHNNDYHIKADFFFRRKTQKLCQGTVSAILSTTAISIYLMF